VSRGASGNGNGNGNGNGSSPSLDHEGAYGGLGAQVQERTDRAPGKPPAVMTHPRPGAQGVSQRRSGQDVSVMVHLGEVVIVCSTTQ
jgi:hypothetical protein